MPANKRIKARYAVERSVRAKWKHVRFKDNRLPETLGSAISSGGCWCGEPYNHDWDGKDQGEPHPVVSGKGIVRIPPHVLRRTAVMELQKAGVCPVCRGYPKIVTKLDGSEGPWCPSCYGTGAFPPPKSPLPTPNPKEEPTITAPKSITEEGNTVTETQEPVRNAATNLADALEGLPDNWLICRDMRHAWEVSQDFHVLATTKNGVHEISRVLKCLRCETRRQERYIARNMYGLEKVRQSYLYPEGYQITGVPRGAKPSSIVQQEQYKRAMERAALLARRTSTLPPD